MFEPIGSWDVVECLRRAGLPAIYGTKKPMNTGFTGYFFTFLSVEPGAIWHPLEMPSNHRGLSPFLILRTWFRTSHLSTALCSFTLLLKVTI